MPTARATAPRPAPDDVPGPSVAGAAPRRRPRARAFTLIELVIVILIVLVLAALLAPALAEALGAAHSLSCRNHLRQIMIAYGQYLHDSGGIWPPLLTTTDLPTKAFLQIEADTGLVMAPIRPAADYGQPGPHWSIILYPYLRDITVYTCPGDRNAGRPAADVLRPGSEHSVGLLSAPPESYGLNTILFRTADAIRRQAGCTWGLNGDVDYNGLNSFTTMNEQRLLFRNTSGLIVFFCGTSGQTVGSQFNVAYRTWGQVDRWEWHPRYASAPFVDEPGTGSNYAFGDGHVEFRDELPPLHEWGYDLGPRDAAK
jgi:prepilin-type N-terminal cleavage/methylation domain-containing protein/prepilin-type processing-associated H-X9-DG protein